MSATERQLFNIEEAEDLLRLSRATLYRLAKAGKIPHRKIAGTGIKFTASDLDEILASAYRPAKKRAA